MTIDYKFHSVLEQVTAFLLKIHKHVYNGKMVFTGSRYFGIHTSTSDWDFFIPDDYFSTLTDTFNLRSLPGAYGTGYYQDKTIRQAYTIIDAPIKVDIQVVLDDWFDLKIEAQHRIAKGLEIGVISKDELKNKRRAPILWDRVLDNVKREREQRRADDLHMDAFRNQGA